MQGHISGTYVRLLFEWLDEQGMEAEKVLQRPCPELDERVRVPFDDWRVMLERVYQLTGDPVFGLKVGKRITPRHLGVLGYVTYSCNTLGEALLRLQRFEDLVHAVNDLHVSFEGELVLLQWGAELGATGQLADQTAQAVLVSYLRQVVGEDFNPVYMSFINEKPADLRPYEEFFACPVHFEAAYTTLAFPAIWLTKPLNKPDPVLRDILDRQAENLLQQLPANDEFITALRQSIHAAIHAATPNLDVVAMRMCCSPRTLQRRLDERGLKFQILLDDARLQLAKRYLSKVSTPLSEVALLLGYAEQSAFNHAFKRWTGVTPKVWREKNAALGATPW
ncbi:MAG TPA: AraC family transcriptional regulator ligand-binding domain-containing protein [Fluviicoccus sp.]|nr:AraC family transcriptional regulator ligand-binding domain-containing protein [Fluviicoccus sp.]